MKEKVTRAHCTAWELVVNGVHVQAALSRPRKLTLPDLSSGVAARAAGAFLTVEGPAAAPAAQRVRFCMAQPCGMLTFHCQDARRRSMHARARTK